MMISARNQLKGKISAIESGAVAAGVKVDLGGGNMVTATITAESVEKLGLIVGDEVMVVVKASDVMIAK